MCSKSVQVFRAKKKMKTFLLINLFIGISVSLKQNEICKNSQKECKGKYNSFNSYFIDCNQVKCHGNHSFKCNHIYCTTNAKSCIDFYNLNRPSASLLKLPQRINKNSMFESKIKDCNLKQYKLNKDNVCKNTSNSLVCDHLLKIKSNKTSSFYDNFPKCTNTNQRIKQFFFGKF